MTKSEDANGYYDWSQHGGDDPDVQYEEATALDEARVHAANWTDLRAAYVNGDDVEVNDRRGTLHGEGVAAEAEHNRQMAELELSAAQVESLQDVARAVREVAAAVQPIAQAFLKFAEVLKEHPDLQPLIEHARRQREIDKLLAERERARNSTQP